jgi:hypothetical protein
VKIKHGKCAAVLLVLLAGFNFQPSAPAQGTAFTYQGRLSDGVNPASGNYDLRFTVYDSSTGGIVAGGPLTNAPSSVSNGLFTVTLEFGPGVFTGSARWLEIGVRTNGSAGAYQALSPRQGMTAAPYAVTAGNVTGVIPSGSLSGTYPGAVTLNNAANSFTGSGAGLTSLNASQLTSGTVPSAALGNAWRTVGNSGTSPTNGNFLGTTDNQPMELWVNAARAFRLEPSSNSNNRGAPNVIGGSPFNYVASGVGGGTIAGGGSTNYFGSKYTNSATADFATVSGGADNTASGFSATVSGLHNKATGSSAVVGGGQNNLASGSAATVGGGVNNTANASSATVSGGAGNAAGNSYATVGGGNGNNVGGSYSSIAGGSANSVSGNWAIVAGGSGNIGSADYSTVTGGTQNTNTSYGGTVSGGVNNSAGPSAYGTVAGGNANSANWGAAVGGGFNNTASSFASTVSGGLVNTASGSSSTVPGGNGNTAGGDYSFAAGQNANAIHPGAFVWSDNSGGFFSSTTSNQFSVRAYGGVQFQTAGAGLTLDGQAVATHSQLTSLNASNITSGTLAAARMPALTGDVTTTTGSVATALANTGVIPGPYSAANITVDSKGRVIAASNGTAGPGSSNYVFGVSSTFQSLLTPNMFQDATFDLDLQNNGWIHSSGTANYTATQSGLYLIEYTAKAMTTGAPGSTNVSVVAVLNSLQVPGSQNSADVQIGLVTLSKSFIANINASDVLKLQFTGTGSGISLNPFGGSGVGAAKSSISMTIVRIQ